MSSWFIRPIMVISRHYRDSSPKGDWALKPPALAGGKERAQRFVSAERRFAATVAYFASVAMAFDGSPATFAATSCNFCEKPPML
jgi:hypothetical protein